MYAFYEAQASYDAAIRTTEGCGSRGQLYIDAAYETLARTYDDLCETQKDMVGNLPRKAICSDDGMHGFPTALGAWLSSLNEPS